LFSIGNGQTAVASGDQGYIAGCTFPSLSCVARVLFFLNGRYLINDKGSVEAAARLPLTIDNLSARARNVWRVIGHRTYDVALAELGSIERELARLTEAAR
jgi:hypothetical protein